MGASTEGLPVSEVWEEFLRGEEFIPGNSPQKQLQALPAPLLPPPPYVPDTQLLDEVQVWKVRCLAAEERAVQVTGGSRVCRVENIGSVVADDDVSQLTEEIMMLRNTPPHAPLSPGLHLAAPFVPPSPGLLSPGAVPEHVWRARLAHEQAQKLEALDQAEVSQLLY